MFPTLRQRLVIFTAIALGAAAWLAALPTLRAPDGSSGLTLTERGVSQAIKSVSILAVAGLPAIALGVVASASGNPLSGLFAVATALWVLAWRGGPIDGFLRRAAADNALPDAYLRLIVEVLVLQLGLMLMLRLVTYFRSPLRSRWPALAFSDHLGVDTDIRFPQLRSLAAGLVCAAVGGALGWLLLRHSAGNQVLWGLLLAFTIGGLVGQATFPQDNPVGILFSPALVAVAAYVWVLVNYPGTDKVLLAWYNLDAAQAGAPRLPGLALALPIHYASAGVAGCALGVGWAQVITSDRSLASLVKTQAEA